MAYRRDAILLEIFVTVKEIGMANRFQLIANCNKLVVAAWNAVPRSYLRLLGSSAMIH